MTLHQNTVRLNYGLYLLRKKKKREGEEEEGSEITTSCATFFYNSFYDRLFDIHSLSKDVYVEGGIRGRGRCLIGSIAAALNLLNDKERFELALGDVAESHNARGVKPGEYAIFGEVLFWTLRKTLGVEAYNARVHSIWLKIFSRVLAVIMPIASAYEINLDGRFQAERSERINNSLRRRISEVIGREEEGVKLEEAAAALLITRLTSSCSSSTTPAAKLLQPPVDTEIESSFPVPVQQVRECASPLTLLFTTAEEPAAADSKVSY